MKNLFSAKSALGAFQMNDFISLAHYNDVYFLILTGAVERKDKFSRVITSANGATAAACRCELILKSEYHNS